MADLSAGTRLEVREAPASYLVMLDMPRIRPGYRQTEMGVIPEDWESIVLAHLSAFITKGSTPTTYGFKWEPSGVLFLRSECVSEDGLDLAKSMFISPAAHATLRRSEVCDGDILVTITGNVGRVVRLVGVGNANLNQHIARVRITAPNADSQYVYHYLSQPSIRRRFNSITTGQAYPQISLKQVREAEVALPALPRQRAIATVLSDVDALIASLDKLIAKKRDLKQGAMQQLLTGQRRLPGFSGEWEVKRLGDIGTTYGGLTGKTKSDFGNGTAQYIPFLNVIGNVFIDPNNLEQVSVLASESQRQTRRGDMFFNGSSETPEEVGMCAVLLSDFQNVYLNSFCFGFRLREGIEADGLFLAYFFRSREGRKLLYSLAQGATRYNLSKINFLKLEMPFPERDEQTAIAAVLSDMDAEIAALEARRDKTRALKQGVMQELLTGRIRLV